MGRKSAIGLVLVFIQGPTREHGVVLLRQINQDETK